MNYFERFEIQQSYDVDLEKLENQYFDLQSRYHPDLVQNLDEKQRYANIAIELNEGYKILKNDYARAVYLLKLENIDVADHELRFRDQRHRMAPSEPHARRTGQVGALPMAEKRATQSG